LHQRAVAFGDGFDQFQSDDFGRVHVFSCGKRGEEAEVIVRDTDGKRTFSLRFDDNLDLSLVARAGAGSGGGEIAQIAVFADSFGRLHRLDWSAGVVFTVGAV